MLVAVHPGAQSQREGGAHGVFDFGVSLLGAVPRVSGPGGLRALTAPTLWATCNRRCAGRYRRGTRLQSGGDALTHRGAAAWATSPGCRRSSNSGRRRLGWRRAQKAGIWRHWAFGAVVCGGQGVQEGDGGGCGGGGGGEGIDGELGRDGVVEAMSR